MIRVNLMRNMGMVPAATSIDFIGGGGSFSSNQKRQALTKIAVMTLPFLVIFVYEHSLKSSRQEQLGRLNATISRIQSERSGFGQTGQEVEKWSAEKKKAEHRLDVLRELTSTRLREVKALDAIQSLMPTSSWLHQLKIEQGRVNMTGYSMTEGAIPDLIKNLESNSFFTEVEIVSAIQEQTAGGSHKKFELTFKVGR